MALLHGRRKVAADLRAATINVDLGRYNRPLTNGIYTTYQ